MPEEANYTDVIVHTINVIKESGKTLYLTVGWGTHGGGMHHTALQAFSVEGEALRECACFNGGRSLVIEAPRSYKIEPEYNEKTREIVLKNLKPIEEEAIYTAAPGNKIVWKLNDGSFRK
jgi:hypothetical protein